MTTMGLPSAARRSSSPSAAHLRGFLLAALAILMVPYAFVVADASNDGEGVSIGPGGEFDGDDVVPGGGGGGGGVRVICAGLGRTGTYSLSSALDLLGYRTYHYVKIGHSKDWSEWSAGRRTEDELIDLVAGEGYDAVSDNPMGADMYARLAERYPESKVILTVRDDPGKFARSWATLFDTMEVTERPFSVMFPSPFQFVPLFRHLKAVRCRMGTHLGLEPCELTRGWRDKPNSREWLAKQYMAHNLQVMGAIPSERLLVFNVKEGWGPLCHFLGKDVPRDEDGRELPFPNASKGVNDLDALGRLKTGFLLVVYGWIPSLFLVALASLQCAKIVRSRGEGHHLAKKDKRE